MKTTVDKILDAAEVLFAERGFAETSLRTITTAAGVNLAAVNYHFGSKKELIQAVFARFLDPFSIQLGHHLKQLPDNPSVEQLIVILQKSAYQVAVDHFGGKSQFMKLLGFAYNQSQEHVRQFIMANYLDIYTQYIDCLRNAMPHLDRETFYWRINYMLGAFVFTMSSYEAIAAIGELEYGRVTPLSDVLGSFVPVVTAIFEAPSEAH